MTAADRRNERGVITRDVRCLGSLLRADHFARRRAGGRKLSNLSQAEDMAAEAARAAAATLDLDQIASGLGTIDQVDDRAQAQAEQIVSFCPRCRPRTFRDYR